MASSANFLFNTSLPFYPSGNVSGAVLQLTQSPCNDPYRRPLCCGPSHHGRAPMCANWTGAHLVSRGCVLYGTLEAEMALLMPGGSRAFLDVGTYVRGGTPDPTQNELDMIFRTLSVELTDTSSSETESSTGAAASNKTQSFVASTWDATFFNPGEQKMVFGPSSWPHHYTGFMARQYHNYSILWTPDYIAWSLDRVVYRNVTRLRRCWRRRCWGIPAVTLIPWRPQTIRIILRTEDGTTLDPQPSCSVFLRRVSYTPLEKKQLHGPPALFFARRLLVIAIFTCLAVNLLRWCRASFSEVEDDLLVAVGVSDPPKGGTHGLTDEERRRRLEMTPLLHARWEHDMPQDVSPDGSIYRAATPPPGQRQSAPPHQSAGSARPVPRRGAPADVDTMPLPQSPAQGQAPGRWRRTREQPYLAGDASVAGRQR